MDKKHTIWLQKSLLVIPTNKLIICPAVYGKENLTIEDFVYLPLDRLKINTISWQTAVILAQATNSDKNPLVGGNLAQIKRKILQMKLGNPAFNQIAMA